MFCSDDALFLLVFFFSEYILKGVVNACVGQATGSREHLKMAQQFFQVMVSNYLPPLVLQNNNEILPLDTTP